MFDLNSTQKMILKILGDNTSECFTSRQISKAIGISRNEVLDTLKLFDKNGFIFNDDDKGTFSISPMGIDLYLSFQS